ncbi:unnamed protein product [Calypogeia fissa]
MAWLGGISSKAETEEDRKKAEESARNFFEKIRAAEVERTAEEELRRRAMLQAERDFMQITMWKKFIMQLQGKLRGTMWDPEPIFWQALGARAWNAPDRSTDSNARTSIHPQTTLRRISGSIIYLFFVLQAPLPLCFSFV